MTKSKLRGGIRKLIRESFPSFGVGYDYLNGMKSTRHNGDLIPALTTLDFPREADTLHIFGTGPSINNIPKSTWEKISLGDSLGLNFFVCHDFVPNFISLELNQHEDSSEARDAIFRLLESRVDDFASRGTKIIFKLSGYPLSSRCLGLFLQQLFLDVPEALRPGIRICKIINFSPVSGSALSKTINFMRKTGMTDPARSRAEFGQIRGSLIWAVLIGIRMNYRHIVLSGCDMGSGEHFYLQKGLEGFRYDRYFDSFVVPQFHPNVDASIGPISVPAILESLHAFAEKRGSIIVNGTPNCGSPLDDFLDPWEDQ